MRDNFDLLIKAAKASLEHPGQGKGSLPKNESDRFSVVYLFRHTETFDNRRRIFSGRRNTRLTPLGIKQAKLLAQKLKNKRIDRAFRPNLIRCRQTLDEVLKFHPETEVVIEPLLVERDYGQLTGKSKLKLMRENFELAVKYRRAYDFPPPGGESFKQVKEKRIDPFCRRLTKELKKKKINVAICCTNNTMRLIRMFFEKLSLLEMQTLENPFGDYASYVVR